MARKPLTVGIIGCGTHADRGHYQSLKRVGGMKLVAVCDPGEHITRSRDFTKDRAEGVRLFRDTDRFLKKGGMDAVIVCSPDKFHAEQLEQALLARKHVLVDKPAAAMRKDLPKLRGALALAKEWGLVVSSCHPRRFNPAYVQIKTMLPDWIARFGQVMHLMLDFSYHVPKEERKDLHTGMLADHLNHETDFMRFLLGTVMTEFTKLDDFADRYEVAGMRGDDIAFHFSGTRRLKGKTYPETIRIRFERGEVVVYTKARELSLETAKVDPPKPGSAVLQTMGLAYAKGTSVITVYDHEQTGVPNEDDEIPARVEIAKGAETNYEVAFDGITRNFIAAIRGEEPCYLSHDDIFTNSRLCVRLTYEDRLQTFC